MAITLRKINAFAIQVSGMDTKAISKQAWRKELDNAGAILQAYVAASFAGEKTEGRKWLKKNTTEYDAYKVAHNFDYRRGHKTGYLQSVLNSATRLYTVSAIYEGRAVITMREDWLRSRVPYAGYYEAAKVRSEGILALNGAWADAIRAGLEALASLAAQRAANRQPGANTLVNAPAANKAYAQILRAGKYGQFKKALEAAERMFRR